ncbi:MAG: TRAP transporter small permease [candidate division WOR-3 bacterium]
MNKNSIKNENKDLIITAKIAGLIIIGVAALQVCDIMLRTLLSLPITGCIEISKSLIGVAVYLSWAYAQRTDSFVRLKLLYDRISESRQRLIDIVAVVITLGVFVLWGISSTYKAYLSFLDNRMIPVIGVPLWPLYILVVFGVVLVFFYGTSINFGRSRV